MPRPLVRAFISAAILLLCVGIYTSNYKSSNKQSPFPSHGVLGVASDNSRHLHSARTLLDSHGNSTYPPLPDLLNLNLDNMANAPHTPVEVVHDMSKSPEDLVAENLIPGLVPSIVHFVWCGSRFFDFKHYLSLLSVIKVVKPDKLIFHYDSLPVVDKLFYYQWLDNLKHDYPFLQMEKLTANYLEICSSDTDAIKLNLILSLLEPAGGIYIGENTWITEFQPLMRLIDLDYAIEPHSLDGYIILRGGVLKNWSHTQFLKMPGVKAKSSACSSVQSLYNGNDKFNCINVKGGRYNKFFPMAIWDLDDPFGRLCRKLFYNTEEILTPKPNYDELVPNIGHMIWLGGGKMDFMFYLSALSMLYVVNVNTLYMHCDVYPTGYYWNEISNNKRVKVITRPQPRKIYQGEIEWYYRALMSDIIRVDIMINYGGIYTDTDAIWVRGLTKDDRAYDAVASFDWVDWSWPYPDSVNFGLSYGKKNAPFWRIFRDSMRTLHNDIHGFTGVMMPYKLLERYPNLIKIDRHLQVICYQQRCHPIWVDDYHNMDNDHITMNSIPNWRKDVNAFHWTHPNPKEYKNQSTLMNAKGMFAEIGRFVLKKAGLI